MNGNVATTKIIKPIASGDALDQIASLKERMAAAQAQVCLLLDETKTLGLKWNFNLTERDGRHECAQMLIREY